MKVEFKQSFTKDLKGIKDRRLLKRVERRLRQSKEHAVSPRYKGPGSCAVRNVTIASNLGITGWA
jgi:hypothetical protein